MSKSVVFASDLVFDLVDSLREREKEMGQCDADANAFTLGYIGSTIGSIVECLPPKARAQVMQELQSRIDDVRHRLAARAPSRQRVVTL